MRYKTKIRISNEIESKYLDKGDVFDLDRVHINHTGVIWVDILFVPNGDQRERPESLTIDVIDRFCEEVKEVKKTKRG